MRKTRTARSVAATPVRVNADTYRRLQRLAAKAAREGWQSLGIKREDPPTLTAVVDAALTALESA